MSQPALDIVIYTRAHCHLCDTAEEAIRRCARQRSIRIEKRDVDADEELRAKYGDCVPVVVIDGIERFRGRINEALLRRLFEADKPYYPPEN